MRTLRRNDANDERCRKKVFVIENLIKILKWELTNNLWWMTMGCCASLLFESSGMFALWFEWITISFCELLLAPTVSLLNTYLLIGIHVDNCLADKSNRNDWFEPMTGLSFENNLLTCNLSTSIHTRDARQKTLFVSFVKRMEILWRFPLKK